MEMENRLPPAECSTIEDVRAEIDQIDRAVIRLIAARYQYVLAAARFKTSATAVRAPDRFRAMLEKRREWAKEEGLNPDAIERLYSELVSHFIEEEMKHWQASSGQAGEGEEA